MTPPNARIGSNRYDRRRSTYTSVLFPSRPDGLYNTGNIHRSPPLQFSSEHSQPSARTGAIVSWWKPRCRISTSQQKSWITSSTTYMTRKTRLGTVASSPNHGSHVLENTFSPISGSIWCETCSRGKGPSRILQHLLHITPEFCSSTASRSLQLQKRKRMAVSEVFPALRARKRALTEQSPTSTSRRPLSPHSTDSHPSSNPSG